MNGSAETKPRGTSPAVLVYGLWAGLGLVLGLSAWVVLSACGLAGVGAGTPWLNFCPVQATDNPDPGAAALEAERFRERLLEERLDHLQMALANSQPCPRPPPAQIAERPAPEPLLEPEPPSEPEPVPEPRPDPETPPPDVPQPDRRPTPPPPPPAPEPEPELSPPPVDEFDRRVEREGGQRGEVQITLLWDNGNDLDLHVYCPDGTQIWYAGMWGCGGELDIDANAGGPQSLSPVENVTWPSGAPSGPYRIEVDHYANHGGPEPTRYRVRVRIGELVQIFEGALAPGQPNRVIPIFVP